MIKKSTYGYFVTLLFFLPTLVFAAPAIGVEILGTPGAADRPTDLKSFACLLVKLFLDFVPYIVVIAVGGFLMGLISYISHGDNEEKRSEGRKMMIYGIVGFFFIVSVWGILNIFVGSFSQDLVIPQFNAGNGPGKSTFVCD